MTPQMANFGRFGNTRKLYELAEPNCNGRTRVHGLYFNGLLGPFGQVVLAILHTQKWNQ